MGKDKLPKKVGAERAPVAEVQSRDLEVAANEAVAALEERVTFFIEQVEKDAASGLDVDSEEIIGQLQQLQTDTKGLLGTFVQRLKNIVQAAAQAWVARKDKQLAEQMAVPDNQKVIKHLLGMIADDRVSAEQCVAVYHGATKEDSWHWEAVQAALDKKILPRALGYVRERNGDSALKLWD